jgi:hypothetical protein
MHLPATPSTLGLTAILGDPPSRRVFLVLLKEVRTHALPEKTSQEKAIHLHRPDLGRGHIQDEGEKEQQEQEPHHFCREAAQRTKMPHYC